MKVIMKDVRYDGRVKRDCFRVIDLEYNTLEDRVGKRYPTRKAAEEAAGFSSFFLLKWYRRYRMKKLLM